MSKYDPLIASLGRKTGAEWLASFAELETLLGFALPKAARAGQGWWAKGPWLQEGWEAELDRAGGLVAFRRHGAAAAPLPVVGDPPILQRLEVSPKLGAALIAGGVAVAVGLGAFAISRFVRKRNT